VVAGLQTLRRAWEHLNHRGYIYVWGNLLVVLCSIPVVTAPAAWAGLVKMSYNAHFSSTSDINDFWSGFKENLGRGLVMTALNLLIIVVNVTNLIAYQTQNDFGTSLMRIVWVGTLFVWFTVQFYMWPIFYHMQTPTLLGAMRNALVMLYLNPLFTLTIWLGICAVIALSVVLIPAWVLLTVSTLGCFATSAALDRMGVQLRAPEEMLTDES
jgi:uncharacterized membrane protein YesL